MIAKAKEHFPKLTIAMTRSRTRKMFWANVTPEVAKVIWDKYNTHNRTFSEFQGRLYQHAMENGFWEETCWGLAFDKDGILQDGQHRVWAIHKSGIAQNLGIAVGNDRKMLGVLDQGRKRSTHDCLMLTGRDMPQFAESILRTRFRKDRDKFCNEYLWNLFLEYKDAVLFATNMLCGKSYPKGVSTSVTAACVMKAYEKGEDKQRLAEFCEVLKTGIVNSVADTAAIKLRDWLSRQSMSGEKMRADAQPRILSAIYYFCRNSPCRQLRVLHGLYDDAEETASV